MEEEEEEEGEEEKGKEEKEGTRTTLRGPSGFLVPEAISTGGRMDGTEHQHPLWLAFTSTGSWHVRLTFRNHLDGFST